MSQDERRSIMASVMMASGHSVQPPAHCKPMGRISYMIEGQITAEADFYSSDDCQYMLFLTDGKVAYAETLSPQGVQFFQNITRQVSANEPVMSDRLAIVDLGTNTFHLLIVQAEKGQWHTIYRERIFINLAEDGIDHIGPGAWDRGLDAMKKFASNIHQHAAQVRALGTAALRRADNASAFLAEVLSTTGIEVDVISGEVEASLITAGVLSALPPTATPVLIMDIGGGSVEFILYSDGITRFTRSFPIGVAILYDQFHNSEPISARDLKTLDGFLEDTLADLLALLPAFPDCQLIGASGTFEVVDQAINKTIDTKPFSTFERDAFEQVYRDVIAMTLEERLANPGIPNNRAQYIVTAFHLIHYVLRQLRSPRILISNYAMKEGVVKEWMDNLG